MQDQLQSRSTVIAGPVPEQEHSNCTTNSRAGAQALQDQLQSRSTVIAGPVAEQEHRHCRTSCSAGAQSLQGQLQSRSTVIAGPVPEQEHSHYMASSRAGAQSFAGPVAEQEHSHCRTSSRAGAQSLQDQFQSRSNYWSGFGKNLWILPDPQHCTPMVGASLKQKRTQSKGTRYVWRSSAYQCCGSASF